MVSLKGQCRRDGIRCALELGQQGIAAKLKYTTPIFDDGVTEALKGVPDSLVRKLLVLLDQCRRADHVGMQDDSELAR